MQYRGDLRRLHGVFVQETGQHPRALLLYLTQHTRCRPRPVALDSDIDGLADADLIEQGGEAGPDRGAPA